MAEETITTDPQGQSTQQQQTTTDPAKNQAGQSTQQTIQDVQEDLPEKFKGKSAKEIAESYLELERKSGQHTSEVQQARQNLAQWESLGKVIQGNPALEKLIVEEIQKISKKSEDDPNIRKDQPATRDDTRIAVEKTIVKEFETEHGIDKLSADEKTTLQKRVGKELEEMLDPKGAKNASELIADLPLDRLPSLLRKAYKLATADDDKERSRLKGLLQARDNRDAEFGTIPSSSRSSSQNLLTPEEQKVAKRLNITEEQYLKNKKEIT